MWLKKAFIKLITLSIFISMLLLTAPSHCALEEDDDAYWNSVLKHFQELFHAASNSLTEYQLKVDADRKDFARDLARLEKTKGQILLWFGGSYDPSYLGYLYDGIRGLRREVEDLYKPFFETARKLEYTTAKLRDIEAEISSQLKEEVASEYVPALQKNLDDLWVLMERIDTIRSCLGGADMLYRSFTARLDEVEISIREKTRTYWKIYYLEPLPPLFSNEVWEELQTSIDEWKTLMGLLREALLSTTVSLEFRDDILTCLILAVVLSLIGAVVNRKASSGAPAEPQGEKAHDKGHGLLPAWYLFSLAVGFSWVENDFFFALYPIIDYLINALIATCMVVLAIYLHKYSNGVRPGFARSLWLLTSVMMLGATVRMLMLPYLFASVIWAACLCGFAWAIRRWSSTMERGVKSLVTGFVPWTSVCLAVAGLIGFLPLSILVALVLFYFFIGIFIGFELLRWLSRWESGARKRKDRSLFVTAISGLGYPIIILGLVYLNLWFMASQLGGASFFFSMLSAEIRWDTISLNTKSASYVIVGFFLTRSAVFTLETFIDNVSRNWEELDSTVKDALLTTVRYALWSLFVLSVLSLSGFNLASLAVVAGGLSVGIGFGLQHIVSNFFGGLILLLGRSIQAGDTIQIDDILGDVRRVTIRNTVVQTRDNATLFIPNSELISNKLINWSHRDKRVIREVDIGVAYGSDTDTVRQILTKACTQCPSTLTVPEPQVLFWDFASSSLTFKLRFWIDDVGNELQALSDIRFEIERLFRQAGIEIAFPQADVHVRTAPGLERLLAVESLKFR